MRTTSVRRLAPWLPGAVVVALCCACQQPAQAPETPTVGRIEPQEVHPGSALSISGTGFGGRPEEIVVKVGDVALPVELQGADTLVVNLPPELAAGTYQVTVTNRSTSRSSGPAPLRVVDAVDVITVPAGTPLRVRTGVALSSSSSAAGQRFPLTLAAPLVVDGREIAPAGSRAVGRVTQARQAGRVRGVAELGFTLVELEALDGARTLRVATDSHLAQGRTTKKRDAAMVGGGAVAGAVVGGLLGGKRGALIGAGAGAAAGTGTALATRGQEVVVPAGSSCTFVLKEPVELEMPGAVAASGE